MSTVDTSLGFSAPHVQFPLPEIPPGEAELAVKIMKSIIAKANKYGTDVWKAILEWRNSPTPSQGSSPVQRLMSRRTRSFPSCKASVYQPELQRTVPAQAVCK